jgi:hypothetical protein
MAMRDIEAERGTTLAGFLAGWDGQLHELVPTEGFAVMGLTSLGEHPVSSTRLVS